MGLLTVFTLAVSGSALAQAPKAGGGEGDRPTTKPPGGETAPGTVIVKFKEGTGSLKRSYVRFQEGLEKGEELDLIDAEVDEVEGRSVEEAVRDLNGRSDVEYAVPDRFVYPAGYSDEPLFEELWGLNNTGQTVNGGSAGTADFDVNGLEASQVSQGNPGLTVAVIDDGVDFSHPDLRGRQWVNPGESGGGKETNGLDDDGNGYVDDVNGYDFRNGDGTVYDEGEGAHGTRDAGTIAASANGEGIVGVAPNVKVMALKFMDQNEGTVSDAVKAIGYAKSKGAKIVNASWGYEGSPDPALKDAIETSGALFVAAAGNGGFDGVGDDNDADPNNATYPASYDSANVLSVAAVNNRGELAGFSNYGAATVDLSAPGEDILSAVPGTKQRPGAVLSPVGSSGGKALVAGFGAEEIEGAADQASFVTRALGAIGRGTDPVALVDDDQSAAGLPDAGSTLSEAIRSATGQMPEVIEVTDGDGPALTELTGKTVVWATGQAYGSEPGTTTLTDTDQQTLTSFLNGGGKLVLAGMDALYLIEESAFVRSTLALDVQSDVGSTSFEGSSGTGFAGESYELTSSLATPGYHDAVAAASSAATQGVYPGKPGSWEFQSGTSAAAPYATGAAALAGSSTPDLLADPAALKVLLTDTAKDAPETVGKTATGKMADAEAAIGERVAPTVVSTTPADDATDVPRGINVQAVFSEGMDASTLRDDSFTLVKRGAATPVPGVVSYDAAAKKAVLDPEADLDPGAVYDATIKGGAGGARDLVGNALAEDHAWSFAVKDDVAPAAPSIDLAPQSDTGSSSTDNLTNDSTPTLVGGAEAGSTVKVYDGTGLLGTATASPTGSWSFTAATLADGAHPLSATATDAAGNASVASAVLKVTVDTAAPDTTIGSGPSGSTNSRSASFSFSSGETGSSFECSLDGGAYGSCSSPKTYTSLADGTHAFEVKATDTVGNADATPASRTWTVDTVAPSAPVVTAPTTNSYDTDGSIVVSGTAEANSTVELFDGTTSKGTTTANASGNWSISLAGVAEGSHSYTAKARDAVGNASGPSAAVAVTVDTRAPETTVDSGPEGYRSSGSASFAFSASESGSTFECSLDNGAFSACASPKAYASLADGSHTFRVRATDAAGNADATPASRTWQVDATVPSAGPVTEDLVAPSTLDASAVPVMISWSGTDGAGSGVARYELQKSTDGSGYSAVALPTATATSVTLSLEPGFNGTSYQFRVRSQDKAGNWSAWSTGTARKLHAAQENGLGGGAISYTAPCSGTVWPRVALSGAYGGYVANATCLGAKAKFSFTGGEVAWVTTKGPNYGKAEVWVDGVKATTLDLYSATTQTRQAVFRKEWASAGSHVVEVRVLGAKNASSTGTRVDVDAFLILN